MANSLTCNPRYIDTAAYSDPPTLAAITVAESPVLVNWVVWSDITTDGHDLIIEDASGNEIIAVKGYANTPMNVFPDPVLITNGMLVGMDSGTLHIEVD